MAVPAQVRPAVTPPRRRSGGRRRVGHPTAVLVTILVGQLMLAIDLSIVNIALPDIGKALSMSPENLSWTVNAYSLAFGGLLLLGARAGDLLGHRRVFVVGIALFTLASLLGGLSQNAAELLAARGAQGVGGALAAPTALALLMTQFREGRERTRAVGLYSIVSIGGTGAGLVVGGLLVAGASWRWIFLVNLPIGVALTVLSRFTLPESGGRQGRFDLLGALTSTIGMTALVYGFVRSATDGWSDAQALTAFAVGVTLMGVFVVNESRVEAPITPLRLFASRTRCGAYLGRLLVVAGIQGAFFFLSQVMQEVYGYSPVAAGCAFIPLVVALFAGSRFAASRWAERLGPRKLFMIGLPISTAGVATLGLLSEASSYPHIMFSLIAWGFGNGLAFVPMTTTGLSDIRSEDAGAASGMLNAIQQMGGSLGLSVLITVFSTASHGASSPGVQGTALSRHAFIVGADHAFFVAGTFLFIALVLTCLLIRPRRTQVHLDTPLPAVD